MMRGGRRLRRIVLMATASALCAGAALAQDGDPIQRGNQLAYDAAVKCFIVDGSATGERKDAGDTAKSAYYESKARLAFDTALKLGELLGYSGTKISEDFGMAQTYELPKIVKSTAYYRQVAGTCKALGLM